MKTASSSAPHTILSAFRPLQLPEDREHMLVEIAHDLQTPLAILKGEFFFLQQELKDTSRTAVCDRLIDSISKSITSLLYVSRLEHTLREEAHVDFSLSNVIMTALDDIRVLADAHGIAVYADITENMHITGLSEKLRELALNILSNSIKYMGESVRREIRVTLRVDGNSALLTFADTGSGIPPADLPHLYKPFARGRKRASEATGTGLGLAIVKRIADAHGANLKTKSESGKGTKITLRLPLSSTSASRRG